MPLRSFQWCCVNSFDPYRVATTFGTVVTKYPEQSQAGSFPIVELDRK